LAKTQATPRPPRARVARAHLNGGVQLGGQGVGILATLQPLQHLLP
jgi:hypothetical protein